MAGLTWIFFGICVVSCVAQWRPARNFNRPPFSLLGRPPFPPRGPLESGQQNDAPQDNKCYTMTRQPRYTNRLWQYECRRTIPGVPVVHSYIGRMGPMCLSYFRMPQYQHYTVETCCPGWSKGPDGKCSTRTMTLQPRRQRAQDYMRMMGMAANLRSAMRQRMRQRMQQRRAMMAARMGRQSPMTPPMTPPPFRRPMHPLPMYLMMRQMRNRQSRRPSFLGASRPTRPPMPHPVDRPPISRIIRIVRTMFPLRSFLRNRSPFPRPPFVPEIPPRMPGVFFPNRMRPQFNRMMRQMRASRLPQIPQSAFPEIPPRSQLEEPHYDQPPMPLTPKLFPIIPDQRELMQGPRMIHLKSQQTEMMPLDQMGLNVDLPERPIQMPDIIVEQGPLNADGQESCLTKLEAAVKSCLNESNIDVPDIMAAFEPLNDQTSAALCRDEEVIFTCINDVLLTCPGGEETMAAEDMFQETVETVRSMCDMREITVSDVFEPAPDTSSLIDGGNWNVDDTPQSVDTTAKVDKMDAVPAEDIEVIITKEEPMEMVQQAIQHEVHVQELKMKEFYLPLLVGAGAGFVLLVLLTALCICCCCKRKIRRKMKLAKELEKPPLDGIYTIGVPPPKYETTGIPPMYYEEAKGEKLTAQSPAVLPDTTETATETGSNTQM